MKLMNPISMALLLLLPFANSQALMAQATSEAEPPRKMRLCIDKNCVNLSWVEDHYEGFKDGDPTLQWRFWLTNWDTDHVEFNGKTAKGVVPGLFPLEGFFSGKISAAGTSLDDANMNWRIGYSSSGHSGFTLTWPKQASIASEVSDLSAYKAPRRSTTNPAIVLPPGAAEDFAAFPDFMRAVLQPESPLMPTQANLACNDGPGVADVVALEIGKFAYRKAEFSRGYCWLKKGASLGNIRAQVLLGASALMGWGTPKDPNSAFQIFTKADGHQDLWNAWFLEKCYNEGLGTAVDHKLASRIDAYLMLRPAGQDLFLSIGADDAEVQKEYQRSMLFLHPPTTSRMECRPDHGPSSVNGQLCQSVSVVDDAALQTVGSNQPKALTAALPYIREPFKCA